MPEIVNIGINTEGDFYNYYVAPFPCTSENDFVPVFQSPVTDDFIQVDLEDPAFGFNGETQYCYKICIFNVVGGSLEEECCCLGTGTVDDPIFPPVVYDVYNLELTNCCTNEITYSNISLTQPSSQPTGLINIGGTCYSIDGTHTQTSTLYLTNPTINNSSCFEDETCATCTYLLKNCTTNVTVAQAVFSDNTIPTSNNTYIFNETQCCYFEYGTDNTVPQITLSSSDLINGDCDVCADQLPSSPVSYSIENCDYPWQIGGNTSVVNFIDGYTPNIGVDMLFGQFSNYSDNYGCYTITGENPIYIPSAHQVNQSDIINETNCSDCIEQNFVAWSVENCSDSSDQLVIALLSTIPTPTYDPTGVNADTIMINGNCYFFSGGPGNINGAEILIDDLDENPITPGGCSQCVGS